MQEMIEMKVILRRCVLRMRNMGLSAVFRRMQEKAWSAREAVRLRRLALWHYRLWQWRHLRWWKRKREDNELQKKDPTRVSTAHFPAAAAVISGP